MIKKLIFILLIFINFSCEKDVTIDLPTTEAKLVVEGRIETGMPPYVILTKSVGFFEEANLESLEKSIVTDARVYVDDGNQKIELQTICSTDSALIPFLPIIAQELGLSLSILQSIKYCIYIDPLNRIIGSNGGKYNLSIDYLNKKYTSTCSIPNPVKLDTIFYKTDKEKPNYGFLNVQLSEPKGLGNCYRWFSKRITKDSRYLSYLGASFEDKFIDGKTFSFDVFRPQEQGSSKPDDKGDGRFRYLPNDTVQIKFCSIDKDVFEFFRSFETEVGNNGNPFSAPNTIKTNIKGGALGVWAGYGTWKKTVFLAN